MAALNQSLEEEIKASYESTLRRLMVASTVRSNGDEDDAIRPQPLPEGRDYSSPWRGDFEANREQLMATFRRSHPLLQRVSQLWQRYAPTTLVDGAVLAERQRFEGFYYTPRMLVREARAEAELAVDKLNTGWYTDVVDVFSRYFKQHPEATEDDNAMNELHEATNTAMQVQLCQLLENTLQTFVELLVNGGETERPIFLVCLCLTGNVYVWQQLCRVIVFPHPPCLDTRQSGAGHPWPLFTHPALPCYSPCFGGLFVVYFILLKTFGLATF
jgi:hypothetical protein